MLYPGGHECLKALIYRSLNLTAENLCGADKRHFPDLGETRYCLWRIVTVQILRAPSIRASLGDNVICERLSGEMVLCVALPRSLILLVPIYNTEYC